jgi:hypothetical protein
MTGVFYYSQVSEKAMHTGLSHRLHNKNILVSEQHGFNKGTSAEKAALRLTDSVLIKNACFTNFL